MKEILVIDNSPVVLKYMESLLQKEGYSVRTVSDGIQALDLLDTYVPDIIFVDLVMPYVSGELLVAILRERKELNDTAIIILSAIAAESRIDHLALGADACIAKGPFNTLGRHILLTIEGILTSEGKRKQMESVVGLEDVYSRSITEELILSKHHSEVVLENISDAIVELSCDLRIVYVNASAADFLKRDRKSLIAGNFLDYMEESWKPVIAEYLERTRSGKNGHAIELSRGREVYQFSPRHVKSPHGDSLILIIKDLSLLKEQERQLRSKLSEREKMIKEVYHRVKNNLTMVSSIINLQMGESDSDDEFRALNDLRSRIDSITMVHSKLYRGTDLNNIELNDYVTDLINNIVEPVVYSGKEIETVISFPGSQIDFDKVIPLGIIFTELATNAVKYAFRNRNSGTISITHRENGSGSTVVFADDGPGLPDDISLEAPESLGLNLVVSLVMQLKGTVSAENKNGAVFTIELPRL